MGLFVQTDGDGRPVAFFDDALITPPSTAQAVTQEQYWALFNAPETTALRAGEITAIDPPPPPPLPVDQQARVALSANGPLVCASVPAVSGTYDISGTTWSEMERLAQHVQLAGGFPGGASSWTVMDAAGEPRHFPSATLFTAAFTALLGYRLALVACINRAATSLPASPVAIA